TKEAETWGPQPAADEIKPHRDEASDENWGGEPEPLVRTTSPKVKFPLEQLPKVVQDAILHIEDRTQAPREICATSVLGAMSVACQHLYDVQLPFGDINPLSLYFVSVAESGERKTSADKSACREIKLYEAKRIAKYRKAIEEYRQDEEVWKDTLRKLKRADEDTSDHYNGKPVKPVRPEILAPDPTIEGLEKLLLEGCGWAGLWSSEGGSFLGGWSMRSENRMATASKLNLLWDEGMVKRIRAQMPIESRTGCRLTMHLMIQPVLAPSIFSDARLHGQGFHARILPT
ncbi:unnamed protein product, partial [marine sediment metagenome]